MSRILRNNIKTKYFHVMTQGINKSYIFNKSEDIKHYIKTMYKLTEEHDIKIIAYCIMNNHAHILLKSESTEILSKYMLRLNSNYGKYYNKKNGRVGYVFRDRFRSEGIYDKSHLYNCIKYIYNNPVKAGLCRKPEHYPYSNYRPIEKILKQDENYIFIDVDEDIKKSYKDFIQEYLKNNNIKPNELVKNRNALKELVSILNNEYGLSLRKVAIELNINRERIRTIFKE